MIRRILAAASNAAVCGGVSRVLASGEFDDDSVRLLVERVEHDLEEASVSAGLREPVGLKQAA